MEVVAEAVDVGVPPSELKCSDAIGARDRVAVVCQHELEVIRKDPYHVALGETLIREHAAGAQYDKVLGSQYGFPNKAPRSPVVTPYFFDKTSQNDMFILGRKALLTSFICII